MRRPTSCLPINSERTLQEHKTHTHTVLRRAGCAHNPPAPGFHRAHLEQNGSIPQRAQAMNGTHSWQWHLVLCTAWRDDSVEDLCAEFQTLQVDTCAQVAQNGSRGCASALDTLVSGWNVHPRQVVLFSMMPGTLYGPLRVTTFASSLLAALSVVFVELVGSAGFNQVPG